MIYPGKFIGVGSKRIEVRESLIPGAGMGAFALDVIPKGARVVYRGTRYGNFNSCGDSRYSWVLYNYDDLTGKVNVGSDGRRIGSVIGYVDGSRTGNWTRFVNCSRRDDNLEVIQEYGTIFYRASREIQVGEELLIWYGQDYWDSWIGDRV